MILENVSADHLRQVLAQVEESATSERLMVALTYKEIEDVSQADAVELYGYSEGWASKWFNRLERLDTEPFEDVVYDKPRRGDRRNSPNKSINSSLKLSMNHLKKSG